MMMLSHKNHEGKKKGKPTMEVQKSRANKANKVCLTRPNVVDQPYSDTNPGVMAKTTCKVCALPP